MGYSSPPYGYGAIPQVYYQFAPSTPPAPAKSSGSSFEWITNNKAAIVIGAIFAAYVANNSGLIVATPKDTPGLLEFVLGSRVVSIVENGLWIFQWKFLIGEGKSLYGFLLPALTLAFNSIRSPVVPVPASFP